MHAHSGCPVHTVQRELRSIDDLLLIKHTTMKLKRRSVQSGRPGFTIISTRGNRHWDIASRWRGTWTVTIERRTVGDVVHCPYYFSLSSSLSFSVKHLVLVMLVFCFSSGSGNLVTVVFFELFDVVLSERSFPLPFPIVRPKQTRHERFNLPFMLTQSDSEVKANPKT